MASKPARFLDLSRLKSEDRPLEPVTGLPLPAWLLAVLAVPLVLSVFLAAEWLEAVARPNAPPDPARLLHLVRGVGLSLVFAFLAAWAVGKNWRRALARIRNAEARAREADRLRMERERLAALGTLAAGVAHEVGNPLASISAIVQILERKELPEAERKRRLATIRREIDRITRILRRLFDLARPAGGKVEKVAIEKVFAAVLDLVPFDRRTRDLRIELRAEPEVRVRAPRGTLEQVLLNLLWNAAEAMDGRGRVVLSARRNGTHVEVEVADEGPGIPEEIRAAVFDPFFSTKERGTGLGLSISKSLLEEIHGEIELVPGALRGTVARIRLPAAD